MPTLDASVLEAEIRRGVFRPAYLLIGSEGFLRRGVVNLFKQLTVPASAISFNYSEFDAGSDPITAILQSAQTYPFAAPRRLVLVNDFEALPAESQSDLAAYLRNPSRTTALVLDTEDLDRRTSFFRTLRELTCTVDFAPLKGAALERWAEQYVLSQGCRIAPSALKKLVFLAGSNLQFLAGEIEKLLLYAGNDKAISEAAVESLITSSKQHGIFELTGALGRRDGKGALRLLQNLLEMDESPIGIVAMIARHFRQTIMAKEMLSEGRSPGEISAAVQVPPFAIGEFLQQAKSVDVETARALYARLADLDLRFKSTPADPRMVLESLICGLG